ncbi:MAG TPA: hypothetical protein VK308_16130 [Pyrinomonadaceae bacterium]|jgi:hypothetical protein|nr:hypothetical protein [Pyrinomonadaceae bacterium]
MKEKETDKEPEGKSEPETEPKFKLIKNENWRPPKKPKRRIKVSLKVPPAA